MDQLSLLVAVLISGFVPATPTLTYPIPSCIDKQMALDNSILSSFCDLYISHSRIFLYLPPTIYHTIVDNFQFVARLSLSSYYCVQLAQVYACHYVFPPCEENATVPIAICKEDCVQFVLDQNKCTSELEFIFTIDSFLLISRQCNNTLQFVEDARVEVNASTECIDISGILSELVTELTEQTSNSSSTIQDSGSSSKLLVVTLPTTISAILLLTAVITAVVLLIFWWRFKKNQSNQLKCSSASAQPSNSYLSALTSSGVTLLQEDEHASFKLSLDDVTKNLQLKQVFVSFHCLKIQREIGHGAFGSVFRGKYTPENSEESVDVAVKTIKSSSASYSELKGFLEESAIMCGFNHPHVLGLIGISLDPSNSPHLLLPFMENGDLRSYLKKTREVSSWGIVGSSNYPKGLDFTILFRMCQEVAEGMAYLSMKKLVHRDLAARNCMVDGSLSVRVADFGLTRDIYETDYYRQSQLGRVPVKWMAPESLHDRISDEKTDVWSYGVTCWEIFSLAKTPYPSIPNAEMMEFLDKGQRLKKPKLCPESLYDLMKSCWSENSQSRPSFSELCHLLSILPEHEAKQELSKKNDNDADSKVKKQQSDTYLELTATLKDTPE